MSSDETRRVLKLFGVAVTSLEDALDRGAPAEELGRWERELGERLDEILTLVGRLRAPRGR